MGSRDVLEIDAPASAARRRRGVHADVLAVAGADGRGDGARGRGRRAVAERRAAFGELILHGDAFRLPPRSLRPQGRHLRLEVDELAAHVPGPLRRRKPPRRARPLRAEREVRARSRRAVPASLLPGVFRLKSPAVPALIGAVLSPLRGALAEHLPLLRDPPLLLSLIEGIPRPPGRHDATGGSSLRARAASPSNGSSQIWCRDLGPVR